MTPTPSHVATDELIETLERLEKEATPRPWVSEWDADDDVEGPYMVGGCIKAGGVDLFEASDGCRAKDLDAVAEIRNHLPALISALKENKRMRELNDEKTNAAILQAEWGAGYDHKVALAARAARHFGGQALVDYLNNTGSGNNAQLVRAFAAVGDAALQPQGEK